MITTHQIYTNRNSHYNISFKAETRTHFKTSVDSKTVNYTSAEELKQDYINGTKIEKLNKIIEKLNKRLEKETNLSKKQKIKSKINHFLNLKSNYVDILVNKHLPFALIISNQFQNLQIPQRLIDSSALLGLFEAAEKWKPSLAPDIKFITYAKNLIKKQIKIDSVNDNQIRLPNDVYWQKIKIKKTIDELTTKNGEKPNTEEIIQELKKIEYFNSLSNNTVRKKIMNTDFTMISLNKTFEKDHYAPLSLEEILMDESQEKRFKNIEQNDLFNYIISKIKKTLTPKEQDILLSKFGFDNNGNYTNEEKTLQELATKYGCTNENIRARIKKICLKLKKSILI